MDSKDLLTKIAEAYCIPKEMLLGNPKSATEVRLQRSFKFIHNEYINILRKEIFLPLYEKVYRRFIDIQVENKIKWFELNSIKTL